MIANTLRSVALAALLLGLRLGLGLAGVASDAAAAPGFDLAGLGALLQNTPRREVRFTETRESQWLQAPLRSSGTMRSSATMLEKRIESPRRETWRILDDRLQLIDPVSGAAKDLLLADAPAVVALAHALRRAMAGDLASLQHDFQLALSGDERQWRLQLTPRKASVARHLKQIELQGMRGRIDEIAIVESQGDRSVTRLHHDE